MVISNTYRSPRSIVTLLMLWIAVGIGSSHAASPLNYSFKDVEGIVHSNQIYHGKWVVVNFWASYCAPCIRELPELDRFYKDNSSRDTVVLGINTEALTDKMLVNFSRNSGLGFPVINIQPDDITPFGPVALLPTTYIISPTGEVIARQQGPITYDALDSYLTRKRKEQVVKHANK